MFAPEMAAIAAFLNVRPQEYNMSQQPTTPVPPRDGDGHPANGNFALTTLVMAAAFMFVLAAILSGRTIVRTAEVAEAFTATPQLTPTVITSLPTLERVTYNARVVSEGSSLFQSTCSACHGQAAQGVPGLGKNLVDSEFVDVMDDETLLQFIIAGRMPWDEGNTTGIAMPAKGGNTALTDDNLRSIIAYIRTANDSSLIEMGGVDTASMQRVIEIRPTEPWVSPLATPEGAPTSTPYPPRPFEAAAAYALSCSGCHGADGSGTALNGPALNVTDATALVDFLMTVSNSPDPLAAFPHPVFGEYPALNEGQIRILADYVISLMTGR